MYGVPAFDKFTNKYSVSNQRKKFEFHQGYNRFNQPKQLLIVILQHTPKFLNLLNQLTQLVPIFASVNLPTIIAELWRKKYVPPYWKKTITVLIQKKNSTDQPRYFCQIKLETVASKVLSSALRNKVLSNNCTEANIQQDFVSGISGKFKHTGYLQYIISNVQIVQRSLTVALLDLGNSFVEVHHNATDCV